MFLILIKEEMLSKFKCYTIFPYDWKPFTAWYSHLYKCLSILVSVQCLISSYKRQLYCSYHIIILSYKGHGPLSHFFDEMFMDAIQRRKKNNAGSSSSSDITWKVRV